jgi:putative FmdB family regulatory protein
VPFRRFDYRCPACSHKWEELVVVSSGGKAPAQPCPKCRRAYGTKLIGAPSIRTNDNAPRDMRTFTTAGHPTAGATVHGNHVWDSQLGKATEGMSAREIERYAKARGLEIVPPREYGGKYLSQEPPPPRLEDDPKLVRETEEMAADVWDRAEAGALPPVQTPLLDEDHEGRDALPAMGSENAAIVADEGA